MSSLNSRRQLGCYVLQYLLIMNYSKNINLLSILKLEVVNLDVTASRYPAEIEYANKILALYENITNSLYKYPKYLIPVLQMYWVCFRGYLVSSQLMLQAHIPEAYTIIGRSAEAVAIARKMSLNHQLILKWIMAENKDGARPSHRLGRLFPKGDAVLYPNIYQIYKNTSDYGRHNNLGSTTFYTDLNKVKTENKVTFTYCDVDDEINLRRCLNYQILAYLNFLTAFREMFKKYLESAWITKFKQVESEYMVYKETLRNVLRASKSVESIPHD